MNVLFHVWVHYTQHIASHHWHFINDYDVCIFWFGQNGVWFRQHKQIVMCRYLKYDVDTGCKPRNSKCSCSHGCWNNDYLIAILFKKAVYFTKNVLPLLKVLLVRICSLYGLWTMLFITCCCSSVGIISIISISNTWSLCFGAHMINLNSLSHDLITELKHECFVVCVQGSSMNGLPKVAKKVAIISLCLWGCDVHISKNIFEWFQSSRWFHNRDIHG